MRTFLRKHKYLFVPIGIGAFALFGFVTMWLWNSLMPAILHLPEINFWQTIGLMILSRLILGMGYHGPKNYHYQNKMQEKWSKISRTPQAAPSAMDELLRET